MGELNKEPDVKYRLDRPMPTRDLTSKLGGCATEGAPFQLHEAEAHIMAYAGNPTVQAMLRAEMEADDMAINLANL